MSSYELQIRQLFGNELVHSTVMIRNDKERLQPLLVYSDDDNNPEHQLWLKMMFYNQSNFAVIDEYLTIIRENSEEY